MEIVPLEPATHRETNYEQASLQEFPSITQHHATNAQLESIDIL